VPKLELVFIMQLLHSSSVTQLPVKTSGAVDGEHCSPNIFGGTAFSQMIQVIQYRSPKHACKEMQSLWQVDSQENH